MNFQGLWCQPIEDEVVLLSRGRRVGLGQELHGVKVGGLHLLDAVEQRAHRPVKVAQQVLDILELLLWNKMFKSGNAHLIY